jgi:hypothetical protein
MNKLSGISRVLDRYSYVKRSYYEGNMSRGSSGSIVSDYGLDDRAIEVRSPTGAEDFSSSPCVQTGFEAYPASYPMGTGVKRGRGVTLTTHSHLVAEVKYGRSYTSSPPMCLHGV